MKLPRYNSARLTHPIRPAAERSTLAALARSACSRHMIADLARKAPSAMSFESGNDLGLYPRLLLELRALVGGARVLAAGPGGRSAGACGACWLRVGCRWSGHLRHVRVVCGASGAVVTMWAHAPWSQHYRQHRTCLVEWHHLGRDWRVWENACPHPEDQRAFSNFRYSPQKLTET
jgi:hypothetical protein